LLLYWFASSRLFGYLFLVMTCKFFPFIASFFLFVLFCFVLFCCGVLLWCFVLFFFDVKNIGLGLFHLVVLGFFLFYILCYCSLVFSLFLFDIGVIFVVVFTIIDAYECAIYQFLFYDFWHRCAGFVDDSNCARCLKTIPYNPSIHPEKEKDIREHGKCPTHGNF
jgi:hypothetical protein